MSYSAVIFGSIGAIAETSEIQRRAFNDAFAQHDVDVRWEREEYRALLQKPGGARRIQRVLGEDAPASLVERLHAAKTRRFHELLEQRPDVIRPGFEAFVDVLRERGVRLAIASTTVRVSIDLILACSSGIKREDFDAILSNDDVTRTKPDAEVYQTCLARLSVSATDAIAVEDSGSGLASAVAAGIPAAVLPGANTSSHDFSAAQLVCADYASLASALSSTSDRRRRA